jgi:acyl-CoA thioester hydrolase
MINKNPNSVYTIRFNDCDLFGHLNNSKYLDYFINAREDHLKTSYNLDLSEYLQKGMGWVIAGHEIAYLRPAVYNEQVVIQSALMLADEDSLYVEAIMMNEKQNQLKSIMRTRLIQINPKTGKKQPHPVEFLNWAKTIENNEISKEQHLQDRINALLLHFKMKQTTNA